MPLICAVVFNVLYFSKKSCVYVFVYSYLLANGMGIELSKNSLFGNRESNSPRLKKHEFILIQIQNRQTFKNLAESGTDFTTMTKQFALTELKKE